MIDILLADGQTFFRDTINGMLHEHEDINLISTTQNVKETLNQTETLQPDVVIMDIHLPGDTSIEATYKIRNQYPGTHVILTTESVEQCQIIKGLMAGANSMILKETPKETLYHTIQLVKGGQTVLSSPVRESFKQHISKTIMDRHDIISDVLKRNGILLTSREVEIVDLFRLGFDNQEIAKRLKLRESTVKNYVSNIYAAIGIHNRREAINYLFNLIKTAFDLK